MFAGLARLAIDLIGLIYPAKCLVCDGRQTLSRTPLLCGNCLAEIANQPLPDPHVVNAAAFSLNKNQENRSKPFDLDAAFAGWRYDTVMQRLVHATKYRRRQSLGRILGDVLAQRLHASVANEISQAVLVPVPLHRRREHKRGFNQSLVLAWVLAKAWHLKVLPSALRRVRFTRSQATLNAEARWENVEGAFAPARRFHLETPTVFLVDDVLTTGATMNACAVALNSAGASKVIGIALAKAG